MKNFDNETGEQAVSMDEPTEAALQARTNGCKKLCVIARFTTNLIAKTQPEPESVSFIPKFTVDDTNRKLARW